MGQTASNLLAYVGSVEVKSAMLQLIAVLSLIAGIAIFGGGILKLVKLGARGDVTPGSVVASLIVGVMLVSLPMVLYTGSNTFALKGVCISDCQSVTYLSSSGWVNSMATSIGNIVNIMGVIFVIRSLFTFKDAAEDRNQASYGKGIAILVTGIFCVNYQEIMNMVGRGYGF